MNTHHILARKEWWSNEKDNKIELRENEHTALHILYGTKTTSDKIRKILEVDWKALQWDFVQDILRILDLYKGDIYQDWIKL